MDDRELLRHWDEVRAGLNQALDQLTDAQLAFCPREGLWSLGKVACHIAGCEEGWLRYFGQGIWPPAESDPAPEDYATVAALKALLAETHARTAAQFGGEGLTERLNQRVRLPWGAEVTLRWCVWHVLEHEIHHRGEIYLMLGLLGMEAPDV
jgi:uncharacterized damage-inducible protein DinB